MFGMFQMTLYIIGVTLCTVITVFISLYLVKLWQIKTILEKFLRDLKNLDKQLNCLETSSATPLADEIHDKQKPVTVCENCQSLKLFVPPDYSKLFLFWCSLHDREVDACDSCPSFRMDLFKWKIE